MSTLAHNLDLLDQHNRPVHSHIEQEPDNYVAKRTRINVLDALDSGIHSRNPANMSGVVPLPLTNINTSKTSQTVDRIDPKKVVPPVNNRVLDNETARPKRTLIPTAEWEGYVESITENEFSVRMMDVRSKSPLPVDQATFSKDDVSEYDRKLLVEGAIVRWIIGRERLPTGQVRNVSELHFRRLPAHSEKDYKRAHEKACSLLEAIIWDNEAES